MLRRHIFKDQIKVSRIVNFENWIHNLLQRSGSLIMNTVSGIAEVNYV